MTLNEYQEQAMTTCMNSSNNFMYMFGNLVGEVGEFASKIAKSIRKGFLWIDGNDTIFDDIDHRDETDKMEADLFLEAGDILWQLSGLCTSMGWSLEEVAEANLAKLAARKENHTIDGNGDHR